VVRVDFILQEHTPWFLEINTIPGLSRESIIPRQAQVAGLSMRELLNIQLEELFTLR
jgi:D-alanine-D-alanine ligase